jgi:acyl-CoA dehydrogenase
MVDFSRTAREADLQARTEQFIREIVIPYERDPRVHPAGIEPGLRTELHRHAKAAGLLAPQAGVEWGGMGLDQRETATIFRASGYSLLGPIAMNCMAPDEGNMLLLETVGTSEQKERFLRPLVQGDLQSAFMMAEPNGAGSDSSMLTTEARVAGGDWLVNGRKWMVTGGGAASFGVVMARTGTDATMFLVEMNQSGVVIDRPMHMADQLMPGGHALVTLRDVRVPRALVLGEPH